MALNNFHVCSSQCCPKTILDAISFQGGPYLWGNKGTVHGLLLTSLCLPSIYVHVLSENPCKFFCLHQKSIDYTLYFSSPEKKSSREDGGWRETF